MTTTTYEIRGSYYVPNATGFESQSEAVDSVLARLRSMGHAPSTLDLGKSEGVYVWLSQDDQDADESAEDAVAVVCLTED